MEAAPMAPTLLARLPPVSIDETLAGRAGTVDLWYAPLADGDAPPPPRCAALLSADERERHERFRFERDRRLFLATRVLVRTVLSRYAPVDAAEWRFAAGPRGKPYIAHPELAPRLHFNLSNAGGMVACAVSTAHAAVGVDVERLDRAVDPLALGRRYFAPMEMEALAARPAAERLRLFFTYWTLKESYIKARGLGLALPLDRFAFAAAEDAVRIHFDAAMDDDAARWRFALLDAPPDHLLAVGVETAGPPLALRAARVDVFAAAAG
jgi:4'-phosphopantetheinyl transferase